MYAQKCKPTCTERELRKIPSTFNCLCINLCDFLPGDPMGPGGEDWWGKLNGGKEKSVRVHSGKKRI